MHYSYLYALMLFTELNTHGHYELSVYEKEKRVHSSKYIFTENKQQTNFLKLKLKLKWPSRPRHLSLKYSGAQLKSIREFWNSFWI